ncbi:MAG TPA: hypothetical protein VM008_14730 [Phycisphaerae bacterium]|nr:hypothetical protein [Phycisphaerae bacterium]
MKRWLEGAAGRERDLVAWAAHLQPVVVVEEERSKMICGRAQLLDGRRIIHMELADLWITRGKKFF